MGDGEGDLHRDVCAGLARGERGGGGGVGIDVEGDGVAGGVALDQGQGFDGTAVVLGHGAFVVADDDGGAHGRADAQGLLDAVQHAVGLVAHVGDIEAAGSAQGFGDRDDLVGRGVVAGGVEQAGGEPGGALRQGLGQLGAHALGLLVRRGAGRVALHGADAERHVADEGEGVDRGGGLREAFGIGGEAAEDPPFRGADAVERGGRPCRHGDRRQADAAIADDDCRDALGGFAEHAGGAAEDDLVVMRVGVDEAGGQDAAGGQHLAVPGGGAEVADGGDAVACHGEVAAAGGGAGSVDEGGVADDEVTSQRHGALLGRSCARPEGSARNLRRGAPGGRSRS